MAPLNSFIEEELQKRKSDYCSSPAYILEHFNIERQNIEAYNGRQLLEMLQNADDACENAKNKKVLIRLSDNILTIANNGEPFNEDGFRSIIYSNLSSKTLQQNKIGQKGLGFRSILSWADEVIINSGGTTIGFSKAIAKRFLENLISESENISNFLKNKSKVKYPIATLRVPELKSEKNIKIDDYDTTITIKLNEKIIDEVQLQIFSIINKETLIFLNHIEEIEIDSPESKIIFKKSFPNSTKEIVTVESKNLLSGCAENKTWHIKSRSGVHKDKNYELEIAWNDEFSDTENVLFSYFKTEVRFPFPALLHGTFELSQDRNQLLNDTEGHNEYLTGELAELLIETAIWIASESLNSSYLPLKLLNIDFDKIDSVLHKFNFKETLFAKIKSSTIFPNVNNRYFSYSLKPVFYNSPIASIAFGDDVENLMPECSDESIIEFLNSFPLYSYSITEFSLIIAKRINKISNKELAKLFFYFVACDSNKKELRSNTFELSDLQECLIDSNNNPIKWNSNIFIHPNDSREFQLPEFINIRFLNTEFTNSLLQELNTDNIETLLAFLGPFGIKKYSFIEIAETLIREYNSKVTISNADVLELHTYLFKLFKNEIKTSNPPALSSEISALVLTEKKKRRKSNEVYFGKYYGNKITAQLYNYDRTKLLAAPIDFGLEIEEENQIQKYFCWLGVEYLPKKIHCSADKEFAEFAMKNYDYRIKRFDNYFNNYKNYLDFKNELFSYSKIYVQSIDGIEQILESNQSETILAWLSLDKELLSGLENNFEPEKSVIAFWLYNARIERDIHEKQIVNYLKWLISGSAWLKTKSGKIKAPKICTTSATITEEFSPLIEKPEIDYDASIFKNYNINSDKVDYLLNIIGVNKTISTFETKTLYSILNNLNEIDTSGHKAKTLYRELAVNFDDRNLDINDSEYKIFQLEGKVFCKKNGVFGYQPNSSVFYVDNKRYGESIINQFYTIEIERRRSQDKILKIFGTKPLKGLKLTLAGAPIFHCLSSKFEQEIESFKAYVYVFRQELDTTGKEKNLIKDIKFKLVTDLSVFLEREQEKAEFSLSVYEYLYLQKAKTIYIKTPDFITDERRLKEDVSFCSTIAEAFSALIDVDAQRQQIRELFSKSVSGRDDIIRAELDDENLEKLIQAKEILGIVNDPKIHFWHSFLKCFPVKNIRKDSLTDNSLHEELIKLFPEYHEIITCVFNQINYDDYNEESSLRLIVQLLNATNLTLNTLNKFAYPSLNISELYDLDFKRIKEIKRPEFKNVLYSLCNNSKEDKKEFLNLLNRYDILVGVFINEINYDVEKDLHDQLLKQFEIELNDTPDINFIQIYQSNKNAYESKSIDLKISKELANQFINERPDLESLLYFENSIQVLLDELVDWIGKTSPQELTGPNSMAKRKITLGVSSFLFDNLSDLYSQLESENIFNTSLSKIKIKKNDDVVSDPTKIKRPPIKPPRKPRQINEDIGFVGEWLVYKHLLNSIKNHESVKWVSEFSKQAGINTDGKDGQGYDLEYIPNDAKYPRYAEVKVVGKENAFHISSNEIAQGEKLRKHYEIFLVRNIDKPEITTIEIIQGPFDYKGRHSFTDNELFSVVNDSFIIRFEKDAE
ncbi:MAG: DUF3883 domain-containing protein [Bacteroidota bacterium]